jgi:hypothetical protein
MVYEGAQAVKGSQGEQVGWRPFCRFSGSQWAFRVHVIAR